VNAELAIAIPRVFDKARMNKETISVLSSGFLKWIHAFFSEKFGVKDSTSGKKEARRKPRVHRGLANLRKQKRDLHKAKKALLKAGHNASSSAMVSLSRAWRKVTKQHNRLRLAVKKMHDQRANRAADNAFKKDRKKFADKLFKPGQTATPTFSKETCQEYFGETYHDEQRDHVYTALEGMIRPGLPKKAFEMRPPTIKELRNSARRKRNGACPGLDAITYVPFKKCIAIIAFLHRLGIKIWKLLQVADDWAQAMMNLLKKGSMTEDLEIVSEFRPITMTATMGKVLLSIISDRLQRFLVHNQYIPRKIQKGFLAGIAGCVEHSFMLFEAMKEAKEEQRQIVVSWIDLMNAYGSVRHNLIQFALDWYHVPKRIQALVFNYYEKLMAKVVTQEWTSDFFLFDIGLFQGCVVSSILFLCVFQLLLDFLRPLREKHGFAFKAAKTKALAEAYADDLALATKNAKGNQICCDTADKWLQWTETMQAKPKKCISFGMKRFNHYKSEKFKPLHEDKTFSPFDPELTIAGKPMNYIVSDINGKFKDKHFKFLGRQIHFYLKEGDIKLKIFEAFTDDVEIVAKSPVSGLIKLWLYQFYIRLRLSWPLLIHDLDLHFAMKLQAHVQPFLKKWAGIGKTVDAGLLYRTHQNLGLHLTSPVDHYTSLQLIKGQLLQHSVDQDVRKVWKAKSDKEAKMTRHFKASQLYKTAAAQVKLDLLFPTQDGRQGLGNGNFKGEHTTAETRKLVSNTARGFAEDKRIHHAQNLAQQGAWTAWQDGIIPFDLSWKNLIYGPGRHIIKFVLNAAVNWVKTPDTIRTWGYKRTAFCPLCRHPHCTLHHIISHCTHALNGGRYTWRHDSVLLYLKPVLQELIDQANIKHTDTSIPPISNNFVRAGDKISTKPKRHKKTLLHGATDWKLLVEIGKERIVYPPEICSTPQRPDIVIWSNQLQRVINGELTCPAEEGIEAAQIRKDARYFELDGAAKSQGWASEVATIEVGARGYVARTVPRLLKRLGRGPQLISADIKNISTIAARCTYAIYLARESTGWDVNRELLTNVTASMDVPDQLVE
jgi:hypothetical protein